MTGVVAASVETITTALRAVFAAERVATDDGFLQRRDPRASLLSMTGLALATMLTRTLAVVVALGLVTVALARLSAVPLRRLLARSAVVPLVSALVVLPQIVLLPGDPLVEVVGVTVTEAGVAYVVLFTLRVGVGVALLSLVVMTTPFSAVVAAMRELRVPVALVWTIAVTYRYLFLFFDELQRLILARNSRTTGDSGLRDGWRDARGIASTASGTSHNEYCGLHTLLVSRKNATMRNASCAMRGDFGAVRPIARTATQPSANSTSETVLRVSGTAPAGSKPSHDVSD